MVRHHRTRTTWACAIAAIAAGCGSGDRGNAESNAVASPLIGGRAALESEFPSAVALFYSAPSNNAKCSMTKVGPRQFLTAAHCVFDNATRQVLPDYGRS